MNTTTTLGFRFEIFKFLSGETEYKIGNDLYSMIEQESFEIRSKWKIRPGSLNKILEIFNNEAKKIGLEILSDYDVDLTVGRSDLIFPSADKYGNSELKINQFINLICKIRKNEETQKLLFNVSTFISKLYSKDDELIKSDNCNYVTSPVYDNNTPLSIKEKDIARFNSALSNLLVPEIMRTAFRSIMALYNNGISDNLTFSNFVDLHPFITSLLFEVEKQNNEIKEGISNEERLSNIHSKLDKVLHSFNYAYNNRIHNSYITGELYELNVFFNGGIQQLVSSISGIHRIISKYLGNENNFVFVEGDPGFSTSGWALRLDYFHLFIPEKLAAVLFQEVLHQAHQKYAKQYPSIFMFHGQVHPNGNERVNLFLAQNIKSKKEIVKYKEYLSYISSDLFEHFFSDIIAFKIFYMNNFDLFKYWSLGYYFTNSYIYKVEELEFIIKRNYLIPILIRQLIVAKYCSPISYNDYSLGLTKEFDGVMVEDLGLIKELIDKFLCNGDIDTWFKRVLKFSDVLSKMMYNEKIDDYIKSSEPEIQNFIKLLSSGKVISFDIDKLEQLPNFDIIHVQRLLFSYISLVKKLACSDGKESLLFRKFVKDRKSDNCNYKIKPDMAKILFDTNGGIFISDYNLRREILRIRTTFSYSIWDFSQKMKGNYIKYQAHS